MTLGKNVLREKKMTTNTPTLYPLGTQCIMRRLGQAALCSELFGTGDMRSFGVALHKGVENGTKQWCSGLHFGFSLSARWLGVWSIIITEENQRFLSPLPIKGDACTWDDELHWWYGGSPEDAEFVKVIERIYPNGTRAPLIQFDEIILPADHSEDVRGKVGDL